MELVLAYIVILNVVTFHLYGFDKRQAKRGACRISERTLLGLSAIGGSVGALLAMKFFRHKTRKPKFYLGVPLLFAMQIFLTVYLYCCT